MSERTEATAAPQRLAVPSRLFPRQRLDRPPAGETTPRSAPRAPSFATVLLLIPVAFMVVMYAYPVTRTLARSVTDPTTGFGNYSKALTDPVTREVLWLTLRIALEVTAACVLLGYPVAMFIAGLPPRWSKIMSVVVIAPFWTSVLVRSFAWIVILGDNGLVARALNAIGLNPGSLLYSEKAVVIAMVQVLVPFMVLTLKGTMDQLDPALMRAARTLGAGPVRAFSKVYLPLTVPAIMSGALLVFIMSLGYYITPALVGGPGQTMIAILIEREVDQTFQWGMAATLSVMLLVVSIAVFFVVRRFSRVEGLVGGA